MPAGTIDNQVFLFTAPRKLELAHQPCPPPGPGQVRCKTICSLVSIGTEMICFARQVEKGSHWDNWIQYPFAPGYLIVGEIADLGEGVKGLSVGQRVCVTMEHRAWFLADAAKVAPVPDGLPAEQAAWFHLNVIVQNGIRETKPTLGETAVVIGLGPLGQLAVRLLGLAGMQSLIAIDPIKGRCDLAAGNGPTHVWQGKADELAAKVAELTKGRGADIVFDITGHPAAFHAAHKMLGKRGRLGLIGDVPFPQNQTMTGDVIGKAISIISAHGAVPPQEGNCYYRWGRREMTELFFDFLLQKRIDIASLITHRIKPQDAPALYPQILEHRDQFMGIVINW